MNKGLEKYSSDPIWEERMPPFLRVDSRLPFLRRPWRVNSLADIGPSVSPPAKASRAMTLSDLWANNHGNSTVTNESWMLCFKKQHSARKNTKRFQQERRAVLAITLTDPAS